MPGKVPRPNDHDIEATAGPDKKVTHAIQYSGLGPAQRMSSNIRGYRVLKQEGDCIERGPGVHSG